MKTRNHFAAQLAAALALAGSAAAQSVTSIPLDFPGEDDGAFTATFSASGAEVFVGHLNSGTITQLDVATATVTAQVDVGSSVRVCTLDEAGSRLFALDDLEDVLHIVDPSTFQVLESIPLGNINFARELCVDDGAGRAVVVSRTSMVVVDFGATPSTLTIPLTQSVPESDVSSRVALTPDGTHAAVFTELGSGGILQSIDLATGLITQTLQLPPQRSLSMVVSPDRSTLALSSRLTNPSRAIVQRYDSATLALLSTTQVEGVTNLVLEGIRNDGSRAVGLAGSSAYAFPATDATFDVSDPAVVEVPIGFPFGVSANSDLTQLAFGGLPGEVSVANLDTGAISRAPRTLPLGASTSFWSRQGDLVGELNTGDRIAVSSVASGVSPFLEANTGFGLEFDGLAALVLSEETGLVLALPSQSEVAVWLDLDSGTPSAVVPLAGRPTATGQTSVGHVVVSVNRGPALGGQLLVFDPTTPAAPAQIPWSGLGVEFVAAEDPSRIWMRSQDPTGDRLVLVDVPSRTIVTSVPLSASAPGSFMEPNPRRETFVVDETQGRAFVGYPEFLTIEIVDLSSGQLQGSVAVPAPLLAGADLLTAAISTDGSRLFAATNAPSVHAFDLSAAGFPQVWSRSLPTSEIFFTLPTPPSIRISGDVVFASLFSPPTLTFTGGPSLVALDAATGVILDSVDRGQVTGFEVEGDDILLNLGSSFGILRFDGSDFSLPELHPMLASSSLEVILWGENGKGLAAGSGGLGGSSQVEVLDLFAGRTQTACTFGTPNATGVQATLEVSGSPFAGGTLQVRTTGLAPNDMFGLLVVGDQLTAPNPIQAGPMQASRGDLCLGGVLGRFNGQVQQADASGAQSFACDTQNLPISSGPVMVAPGTSWTFQVWHRDVLPGGGRTSNTSTAVAVTFR